MRATANLTARLERNLVAYATAASAAGVGIVALAQLAAAKVVYTPIYRVISASHSYKLDLNQDGSTDFILENFYYCGSTSCFCAFRIIPERPNSVVVGPRDVSALKKGARISGHLSFYPRAGIMALYYFGEGGSTIRGNWVNVKNRYLGLRFTINGETHYGWARMNVSLSGRVISGTLTGYAYETIPNKAIIAGNRGSTTGQGPDARPVTLGRLALGAAGRRQHSQSVHTSP